MTDIEIAESITPKPIEKVAEKLGFNREDIELYGKNKAKLCHYSFNPTGKLILVTAINPTAAGEGKTTVSIGLADAFTELNESVCLALREPSLGPVFGMKGGATGGGYSQVVPMADINLHFTGDFHAMTSANNLLCAFIDNHIFQGNELNIDPNRVVFNRCMDMNDRALRDIQVATSGKNGVERADRFNITSASEIMAIMCLASDLNDLKRRLENILVAYTFDNRPIYCKDLKCADAMAILLKDAMKPNLVQTLIGTPAIIHGGPFANIAHGCNSIVATKLALTKAKYVVTEAGFGADLGAEKFLDTKCRVADLKPNCVVVVATAKALKLHGGANKDDLKEENLSALSLGLPNLIKHIENIKNVYHLPVVVAFNRFTTDTEKEIDLIKDEIKKLGVKAVVADVWGKGGLGAIELASVVKLLCEQDNSNFSFAYDLNDSVENKIRDIATKIYGASEIEYSEKAKQDLNDIYALGYDKLPIIIAKTQYSLSDDATKIGAPTDFKITIRELQIRSGAEFIVAIAGNMLLMPGLGKNPAGANMTIDENEKITGLF